MIPNPRLRALDARWTTHNGETVLAVDDRLGLMAGTLMAPPALAVLMSLCDGTRAVATITADLSARTGERLVVSQVDALIEQLDQALVFDSPRFRRVYDELIAEFRAAPDRPPYHAGSVYPADRIDLDSQLTTFAGGPPSGTDTTIRGIISPHIDYRRGGTLYGATWSRAAAAARKADVVIFFGTDHVGSPGSVTLTRLGYRSPYGTSRPDIATIDRVASAIGEEAAFAEEIHHRSEHAIELAAVWLQWAAGSDVPIVPILLGSFAPFTDGTLDPATDRRFAATLEALHTATAGKRVLAVAAADLAHVGPAFSDPPFTGVALDGLRRQDAASIRAIEAGDAATFFGELRDERDARKVCGLPPIYLLLRFLGTARGETLGYDQCQADPERTSWVSITGTLLH